MNIRRIFITVLLTTLVVMLLAGTALADASQEAKLRASFNTWFTGAYTIANYVPNDRAYQVAAPEWFVEGRIYPFDNDQSFCEDTVLGTWVVWYCIGGMDEGCGNKFNEGRTFEFELNDQQLEEEQSPVKRATPMTGYEVWWYSVGV